MACCGDKRKKASQAVRASQASKPKEVTVPQPESDPRVYFQYVGETALTIVGPNSRKRYRFDRPSAVVEVDPRDKRAFSGVTVLRQAQKDLMVPQ